MHTLQRVHGFRTCALGANQPASSFTLCVGWTGPCPGAGLPSTHVPAIDRPTASRRRDGVDRAQPGRAVSAADCPLLPVIGGDLQVPLVDGSHTRYVNLDYAASSPALEVVARHVSDVLPLYASVHRGAG